MFRALTFVRSIRSTPYRRSTTVLLKLDIAAPSFNLQDEAPV